MITLETPEIMNMGTITSKKKPVIGSLIFIRRNNIRQMKVKISRPTLMTNTHTGLKPIRKIKKDNGKLANKKQLTIS